jgi:hypothetical protein
MFATQFKEAGIKRRVSHRELFKKCILPLASEFLLSLLLYVGGDNISTTTNLTGYQKGVYCTGIKLFSNNLLTVIYLNHNIKLFKLASKENLLSHSSIEEFTLIQILSYKYM